MQIRGNSGSLSESAEKEGKQAYDLRLKGLSVSQLLKATEIKSKRTLYKYIKFEAERLAELTGKNLAENGLELAEE